MVKMTNIATVLLYFASYFFAAEAIGKYQGLEFIDPCSRRDPYFEQCLQMSSNRMVLRFRQGFPEITGYAEVEPIILDRVEISLLGGLRATFTDIHTYGVSQLFITAVDTSFVHEDVHFRFNLTIPQIKAVAKYQSSGKLFMIETNNSGDYWGQYDDVQVVLYAKAKLVSQYLRLENIIINFSVSNMKMGVENIIGGNKVTQRALNRVMNSFSQVLLEEMKPTLLKKFTMITSNFVTKLFSKVPYDAFIVA